MVDILPLSLLFSSMHEIIFKISFTYINKKSTFVVTIVIA